MGGMLIGEDPLAIDTVSCYKEPDCAPMIGSPLRLAPDGLHAGDLAIGDGSMKARSNPVEGELVCTHDLSGLGEECLSGPTYSLQRSGPVRDDVERHEQFVYDGGRLCEIRRNTVQQGMEGGGHMHVLGLEEVGGVGDNVTLQGDGDAQEGVPRDCFKENESEIAEALYLLNEDGLCEVPIIQAHGLDLFLLEMKKVKSCGQDGRAKRRRGRPKKQVLQSSEVSDSNLQLVQTILALDQGPSEIVDQVWNMGNAIGVSHSVNSSQFIQSLADMEVRDREAIGRGKPRGS
ncbi:RidA family protein [Sesbania bispinosa]|nr:RidA family protein [Sesbania bispinosa]